MRELPEPEKAPAENQANNSTTDGKPADYKKESKPAETKSDKPKEMKIKAGWSALFQFGVFLVATVMILLFKWNNANEWSTNLEFLLSPLYIVFASCCALSCCYSMATGKSQLQFTNFVMWVIMAVALVMMLGQISLEKNPQPKAGQTQNQISVLAYQNQPLGYAPTDTSFSLDSLGRIVLHFPPGKTMDWSVDSKKERCGNDSLIAFAGKDTLRSWLTDQNWNGAHKMVTLMALAPMKNIGLHIKQKS